MPEMRSCCTTAALEAIPDTLNNLFAELAASTW